MSTWRIADLVALVAYQVPVAFAIGIGQVEKLGYPLSSRHADVSVAIGVYIRKRNLHRLSSHPWTFHDLALLKTVKLNGIK